MDIVTFFGLIMSRPVPSIYGLKRFQQHSELCADSIIDLLKKYAIATKPYSGLYEVVSPDYSTSIYDVVIDIAGSIAFKSEAPMKGNNPFHSHTFLIWIIAFPGQVIKISEIGGVIADSFGGINAKLIMLNPNHIKN